MKRSEKGTKVRDNWPQRARLTAGGADPAPQKPGARSMWGRACAGAPPPKTRGSGSDSWLDTTRFSKGKFLHSDQRPTMRHLSAGSRNKWSAGSRISKVDF